MKKSKPKKNVDLVQTNIDELTKMLQGELPVTRKVTHYVPTGYAVLDLTILHRGGVPHNRIVEIFGATGGGKSIMACRIAAQNQKLHQDDGKIVGIVDTEYSFDPDFASLMGLDTSRIVVQSENVAEEAFNAYITMIESGKCHTAIFDSAGNIDTHEAFKGKRFQRDAKDKNKFKSDKIAGTAKVIGDSVKRIVKAAYENDCLPIIVNQVRDNLNAYAMDKERRPGGRILEHNRAVSIKMTRVGYLPTDLKSGEQPIGMVSKVEVIRSKVSPAGKSTDETHPKIYFTDPRLGIVHETIDLALTLGVLYKKASTFYWKGYEDDGYKWVGKKKLVEDFIEDNDMLEALREHLAGESAKGITNAYLDDDDEEDYDAD